MCNCAVSVENINADPNFYYGEIPQDDFLAILRAGQESCGIEVAIQDWCRRVGNAYFEEYALDPRRALGLRFLGDLRGKRVLDYGCGVGSLSVVAARHGASVTLVDSCVPRVSMAALRISQAGHSVTAYACKSWRDLLEDVAEFDVILVNGVLEWVPSTIGASFDTVLDTQLDFLRSMQGRLAPGGVIYLAIENRFALQYVMGYPEDHTDIPYLSLMPREAANEVHRRHKGSDFAVWTWGLDEFRENVPLAGLSIKQGYAAFPDYRFPRALVALEDREGLRRCIALEGYEHSAMRATLENYFYVTDRLDHVVYSYVFLLGAL